MRKLSILLIGIFICSLGINAQTDNLKMTKINGDVKDKLRSNSKSVVIAPPQEATPQAEPEKLEGLYQIYLDKPAKSVHSIQYLNGRTIKGELSPDRKRIYLEDYTKKGRVVVSLTYQGSSTPEEVQKSSCYIDPVADAL